MSKHTPGLWRVMGDAIYAGDVDASGEYSRDTQVFPPYNCDPKSRDGARHAADLRLIAAAPELLAACRLFTRTVQEWEADESDEATFVEWCERNRVLSVMEAAIARATGCA